MRKNLYWLLLATVLMFGLVMTSVSKASPEPVIRVEPKDNTADVDETFTVTITVTDITEEDSLFSWGCKIIFNPKIIKVANATEGPFLKDTGYETTWGREIDNTTGTVYVYALINPPFPENGATGSGTLAMVTFKVVGTGETGLDFKPDFTELFTIMGEAPNQYEYPIDHTAKNGFFRNAGAPISIELIVGIVVVVILVIVALLYFRRKRASTRS